MVQTLRLGTMLTGGRGREPGAAIDRLGSVQTGGRGRPGQSDTERLGTMATGGRGRTPLMTPATIPPATSS